MKKIFTDQLHHQISINWPPQRIISLVPSQTELLFYLGLKKEIVGITKFCIHPQPQVKNTTKIGGTKKLHLDKIADLQPDLIIGNKEENDKSQIETLAQHFPIWMSDIQTLSDAKKMISSLGQLVNKMPESQKLLKQLEKKLATLAAFNDHSPALSAAYFIWRKPYMIAANDTFIHEMLQIAGFKNIFEKQKRYPVVDLKAVAEMQPQVVLLSSEPFPFKEKYLPEFQEALPNSIIKLVDGEMFSWYGNRLLMAIDYFRNLKQTLSNQQFQDE